MADLLLELFSEEIPARMQARAAEDLKKLVTEKLTEAGLTWESAGSFATPRRLVLTATGLPAETPAMREERKGPGADAPETAIAGFLRSTGLTRDQLETRDAGKGPVLFAVIDRPGRTAAEVVTEAVTETVRNFPWPKSMRWGSGSLRWVRPLHSILCILSDEAGAHVVPLDIDGIVSGDTTRGHRFLAPDRFPVANFEDYAAKLSAAKVVLDPEERRARIAHDAEQLAFAQGLEVIEDKGLLTEVAGLVEWPVVLMGEIDPEFLDLPPEVLRTSMKEHQKFFSVRDPKTGRIGHFVTVANIETADRGVAILAGNRKVLTARLADAKFFWENDLRMIRSGGMEGMAAPLERAMFHARLGTQAERIDRIAALARDIAPIAGADADLAERAARIAKADLASEMVREFPKLQGVMGTHYAKEAKPACPDEVAEACAAHYRPLGPSDAVPEGPVAITVALADKIDMLTGFWAIDEKPTGNKDPFALRRTALGVIRILLESQMHPPLGDIFEQWIKRIAKQVQKREKGTKRGDANPLPNSAKDIKAVGESLQEFIAERLRIHLRDRGVNFDVINACYGGIHIGGGDDPADMATQVEAVQAFLETEKGDDLLAGYRRAANILSREGGKTSATLEEPPDETLAAEAAETELFTALNAADPAIDTALKAKDFETAMTQMANLRAPIDAFFEDVTVNADDPALRRNRLRLLARIRLTMHRVADWEAIEG